MDGRGEQTGPREHAATLRGFTLIELMIVVAIVGILAVLATFGVRKYVANAKTAEATSSLGQINFLAIAAYERENSVAELMTGASVTLMHQLCLTAPATVPGAIAGVSNRKYVADTAIAKDYHAGSRTTGWVCLKYEMSQPQYYLYGYSATGVAAPCTMPAGAPVVPATGWASCANGDLNGDGIISQFGTGGNVVNGAPFSFTQISTQNPEE